MSHQESGSGLSPQEHPTARGSLPGGKSGTGSVGAMAQIRRDRLTEVHVPLSPEEQVSALWLARPLCDRRLTAVHELQAWLSINAPELLRGQSDPLAYLLRVLAPHINRS